MKSHTNRKNASAACAWVVALLGVAQGTLAQTANTGAIGGTVTDPSGALVVGAQIRVNNAATGETRTAISSQQGSYLLPQLTPGTYTLEAAKAGFKGETFKDLQVNVTEILAVNIPLVVGSASESITVQSSAEGLQLETSSLGRVTSGEVVNSLPLVSRNYTQIIGLNPGVSAEVTNAGELGRGGGSDGTDAFVANGGASTDNNFQMNGVEINDFQQSGGFSGGIATPNPDTIQEFKVQTGQYDASYGRNAGANVDVITKGGSNAFHGNLFEFFRNEALNANDYFRNLNKQPRGILRQNQYGFTFGGPIRRNKLLFFTSYQGTRQTNGVDPQCSSTFATPPLTNDRSAAALGALFAGQPTLYQSLLLGAGVPPEVVAVIGGPQVNPDGSNISPQALALLQTKLPNGQFLIPTPQRIDPSQPFASQGSSSFSSPCRFNEDQFMTNGDYIQSEKSSFYARFFFANSNQSLTFPLNKLGGPTGPGFAQPTAQRFRNASLTHNYVFGPKLLNQAEIGYHRQASTRTQKTAFTFSGIGSNVPSFVDTIPQIEILGALTLGGNGQETAFVQNTYIAQDTLSWLEGRHSFRFGGGITHVQNDIEKFRFLGGLIFGSFPDFLLGQSATQNGTPFSNIFASVDLAGLFPRNYRVWDGNVYAQDDIKVTPRLTLNLGFRYERLGDVGEALGRNSNFDPARANPNPPAEGSLQGFLVPSNYKGGAVPAGVTRTGNNLGIRGEGQNTFNPRVGFAWQPPATQKTVLRGGYGIYHSRLTGQPFFQLLSGQPFAFASQLIGAANGDSTFAVPFPAPVPTIPSFSPYSPTTQLSASIFAQNFRPPVLQRYSLNVQTDLGAGMVMQIGYVGTRGTHLIRQHAINQAGFASPTNPIRGETTNTLANIPLRVPLEGFTSESLVSVQSEGSSKYNALEASLSKRFSHGLEFLASYTWSRYLASDVATATGPNGGTAVGDQNNPRSRYGPDRFVRPQRFVFSGIYAFPTLSNRGILLREALGSWKLSGVTTIQSGQLLEVTETNPTNAFGITTDFAEFAPGCSGAQSATSGSVQSRINNYINASCFTTQPVIGEDGIATGFGNSKPGILKGPDQVNTDLSLAKLFPFRKVTESTNLEFRTELFNAFNHPQFANPDTEVTSPTFGHILSTAVAPRVLQLALKLNF